MWRNRKTRNKKADSPVTRDKEQQENGGAWIASPSARDRNDGTGAS
ncbi:MAG: hypothetical protein WCJ84_06200 [Candidatus Peregrinibacteria bacterium]